MKKIVFYEAMDGTDFETERECLKYDVLNMSIKRIKEVCERNGCDCTTCPLFSSEDETCAVMKLDFSSSPNTWEF